MKKNTKEKTIPYEVYKKGFEKLNVPKEGIPKDTKGIEHKMVSIEELSKIPTVEYPPNPTDGIFPLTRILKSSKTLRLVKEENEKTQIDFGIKQEKLDKTDLNPIEWNELTKKLDFEVVVCVVVHVVSFKQNGLLHLLQRGSPTHQQSVHLPRQSIHRCRGRQYRVRMRLGVRHHSRDCALS